MGLEPAGKFGRAASPAVPHLVLVFGARDLLQQNQGRGDADPELVMCVSCVGRRWVLGQRTEEETESVRAAVGPSAVLTGFYSYGELAPTGASAACHLHNQTMS